MKFRLVYDGELPPQPRAPAALKQRIRQQFHPQLKNLWQEHPALYPYITAVPEQSAEQGVRVERIADEYARGRYRFVPLVRLANLMACTLDILVLMRQEPYQVFAGEERGDLDNRIKTLIDGLRMPRQLSEMGGLEFDAGEDPFFCLLEDDKVVYDFAVRADRLLAPPRPDQRVRDVVAVISVNVTTDQRAEIGGFSPGFGLVKR